MGINVPLCDITAYQFTECCDFDTNNNNGIWDWASYIVAILVGCNEEEDIQNTAEKFETLPISTVWEVYSHYCAAHEHMRMKHPNLFKSTGNNKKTTTWYSLLQEVANKKVFDVSGLNSIDSVKQMNAYKFIEYIANERQ